MSPPDHPSFSGDRTPLDALLPGQRARVAGRLVQTPGRTLALRDASGVVELRDLPEDLHPGDLVALTGLVDAGPSGPPAFKVAAAERLVCPARPGSPHSPALLEALAARHRMNRAARRFFDDQGFTEVETPNLVEAPGTDVHLAAFQTPFAGLGPVGPAPLRLHTSPEVAMERRLAAGMERIYQICKVYRDAEWTASHNPEFTMIEWYRAFCHYGPIMDDVEALVRALLDRPALAWGDSLVDLSAPFERLTVQDAFLRHCGLDLLALDTAEALREAACARGLGPLPEGEAWDDVFHALMLTWVEPHLGAARPTFLIDYPRPLAVLARAKDDDPRVAERFELYVAGVELCNGFTELNDPVEQRARFEEDLAHRAALGLPACPMPEAFLRALEQGMPPSGGVALGLDRLLMLSLGAQDIGQILIRAVEAP